MAQQTAVEWLIEQYVKDGLFKQGIYEQAKAIEKMQVINAFKSGEYNSADYFNAECPNQETSENYYNETYNK
jgi:hypothetical protein